MTVSVLSLLLLHIWTLITLAGHVHGSPTYTPPLDGWQPWKRTFTPILNTTSDGNTTVLNPTTLQPIPQGSASDGSGTDFSAEAIIWLAFCFAVGVPLAFVGIKLWRATTGAGVGLAMTVCVWAAFVNTDSADNVADLVLTIISVGAFGIGFLLGVFEIGRLAGILLLGILGGMAFMTRIVLLRPGLLIPVFYGNWLMITLFGLIGAALVIFAQRASLVISCASVGTFLTGLGIDLIVNKQSGMSYGLRYLFDRNSHHYLAIVQHTWNPPIPSYIILAVSLGLTPILAYAQHKIFSRPFEPSSSSEDIPDDTSFTQSEADIRTATATPEAKASLDYFK
ncbi:hypothetical protein A0H81_10284 [Grifola frondosa]|uniref:TM7S3/TM198-like domain-containing protein n=1 Tax=Grifola frondosa TaxID=5627 RepID=A0A1C7LXW6_GRIFR|nr:hypothetical protein A0H81_10284 [Grifola frondosa]